MSMQPLVEPHPDSVFGLLMQYPELHHEPLPDLGQAHDLLLIAALTSRFGEQSEVGDAAEHMRTWSDEEVFEAINAANDITDLLNAEPHLAALPA
jgi:hypothetical protein